MYHIFYAHSSVDGHFSCFYILAIVNSVAVTLEYMCLFELVFKIFFFSDAFFFSGVELLGHMVVYF